MVSLKKTTKAATKKSMSIKDLVAKARQGFQALVEHSGLILFIILVIAVGYAVMTVGNTLTMSTDEKSDDASNALDYSPQFDIETRKKIDALNDTQSTTDATNLPSGRINPFSE